jgi:hypothetical protein
MTHQHLSPETTWLLRENTDEHVWTKCFPVIGQTETARTGAFPLIYPFCTGKCGVRKLEKEHRTTTHLTEHYSRVTLFWGTT